MARAAAKKQKTRDEEIDAKVDRAMTEIQHGVAVLNELRRQGLVEWEDLKFGVTVRRTAPRAAPDAVRELSGEEP